MYHAFGIRREYKYARPLYGKGSIVFVIEPQDRSLQCPLCSIRDSLQNVQGEVFQDHPFFVLPGDNHLSKMHGIDLNLLSQDE